MTGHVKDVCKIGQMKACCRYLVAGPKGFECAKFTEHKPTLDFRAATGQMIAQADGCEGYENDDSIIILNKNGSNSEKTD